MIINNAFKRAALGSRYSLDHDNGNSKHRQQTRERTRHMQAGPVRLRPESDRNSGFAIRLLDTKDHGPPSPNFEDVRLASLQ